MHRQSKIDWFCVSLPHSFMKICKGSLANAQTIENRLDLRLLAPTICGNMQGQSCKCTYNQISIGSASRCTDECVLFFLISSMYIRVGIKFICSDTLVYHKLRHTIRPIDESSLISLTKVVELITAIASLISIQTSENCAFL